MVAGFSTVNFDTSINAVTCLRNQSNQRLGACISGLSTCTFGTEADCYESNGEFYEDYLCSNKKFENKTICIKQNYTGCLEGNEEIYWFDSCGNRKNIYSSDKEHHGTTGWF
jgi:hypothetical protein